MLDLLLELSSPDTMFSIMPISSLELPAVLHGFFFFRNHWHLKMMMYPRKTTDHFLCSNFQSVITIFQQKQ